MDESMCDPSDISTANIEEDSNKLHKISGIQEQTYSSNITLRTKPKTIFERNLFGHINLYLEQNNEYCTMGHTEATAVKIRSL